MLPMLWRKTEKEPLLDLRTEIDRVFEDFFSDGFGSRLGIGHALHGQMMLPALDLRETDDALVVDLEIPGMKPDELEVNVNDGLLVIRGERAQEQDENTKTWHRTERRFGRFERRIALPPTADGEKIDASYKDGVLTVTVPKKAGAKPRTVAVKVK